MKELQILDIILIGILKNELHLKNYLIRIQKELENKNFVSEYEFFQKCSDVLIQLESNIEIQFMDRKKKLQQTIELLKSKNNPFEKELKASENLSLDNFYVNLSIYTEGKYKGELWLSQINYVKKCIDEIHNQKFKITTEIKDLNIENYLNFIFSQKPISAKAKENAVAILMKVNKQESKEENNQIWRDYVFNQQNYWKTLTKEDKKSFEEIRTKSLKETNTLFENYIKGSPKPIINLENEFEAAIFKRLSEEPFLKTTYEFIQGLLPQNMNKLAIIIGKLDFIKNRKEPIAPKKVEETDLNKLTLKQIALKCFYEGKVINRENAKDELDGTEFKSSDKLYTHFAYWSINTNRRADTESKIKLRNKINDLEMVIESLSSEKKIAAISDLNILKGYLS